MSKTNLVTHVKQTHKRNLKDVLKEQGKVDVYSGSGPSAIIVGISGTVVGNVGPGKPRKPKKSKYKSGLGGDHPEVLSALTDTVK